ncbi:hypothetical protein [Natrinema gelatinilyticum]|nr:hypothetical protein [Natrinema gelatinilyticum]
MRLTVFGATGRTGRPLCRLALERGDDAATTSVSTCARPRSSRSRTT